MAYKVRYKPLERLGRDGWTRFEPGEPMPAGAAAPTPRGGISAGELGVNGFILK